MPETCGTERKKYKNYTVNPLHVFTGLLSSRAISFTILEDR